MGKKWWYEDFDININKYLRFVFLFILPFFAVCTIQAISLDFSIHFSNELMRIISGSSAKTIIGNCLTLCMNTFSPCAKIGIFVIGGKVVSYAGTLYDRYCPSETGSKTQTPDKAAILILKFIELLVLSLAMFLMLSSIVEFFLDIKTGIVEITSCIQNKGSQQIIFIGDEIAIMCMILTIPFRLFLYMMLFFSKEYVSYLVEHYKFFYLLMCGFGCPDLFYQLAIKKPQKYYSYGSGSIMMLILCIVGYDASFYNESINKSVILFTPIYGLLAIISFSLLGCGFIFSFKWLSKMQENLIVMMETAAQGEVYKLNNRDWSNLFLHRNKNDVLELLCEVDSIKEDGYSEDAILKINNLGHSLANTFMQCNNIMSWQSNSLHKEYTNVSSQLSMICGADDFMQYHDKIVICTQPEEDYITLTNKFGLNTVIIELLRNACIHSPEKSVVYCSIIKCESLITFTIKNQICYDKISECKSYASLAKDFGEGKEITAIGELEKHIGLITVHTIMDHINGSGSFDFSVTDDYMFVAKLLLPLVNMTREEYYKYLDEQ